MRVKDHEWVLRREKSEWSCLFLTVWKGKKIWFCHEFKVILVKNNWPQKPKQSWLTCKGSRVVTSLCWENRGERECLNTDIEIFTKQKQALNMPLRSWHYTVVHHFNVRHHIFFHFTISGIHIFFQIYLLLIWNLIFEEAAGLSILYLGIGHLFSCPPVQNVDSDLHRLNQVQPFLGQLAVCPWGRCVQVISFMYCSAAEQGLFCKPVGRGSEAVTTLFSHCPLFDIMLLRAEKRQVVSTFPRGCFARIPCTAILLSYNLSSFAHLSIQSAP